MRLFARAELFPPVPNSTMTKTLLTLVLAAFALAACSQQKPAVAESTPPPDVPSLPDPAATPPEPAKTEPDPEPAKPEVAPPPAKPTVGAEVWAIARISIMTDDGVVGVTPGAKLRVVRVTETGYVVTDEKNEFPVVESQISTNSGSGSLAAQADAAARAADRDWQKNQSAKGAQIAVVSSAKQAVGELQNRLHLLTREESQLQASLRQAQQDEYNAQVARNQRRVYTRSISDAQVAQWRARLPVVQSEKDKVFWELKQAQQ